VQGDSRNSCALQILFAFFLSIKFTGETPSQNPVPSGTRAGPFPRRACSPRDTTATNTHRPVPHHEFVQTLTETPGFRLIGVDDGALWRDGMKMFGGLDLNEI